MFGGAWIGAAAGDFLTEFITWLAIIFFVLCAALALVSSKSDIANVNQSGLRDELAADELANEPTPENATVVPATPAESEPVTVDDKK
jgi:preprotein translocase subunit SecG